MSNDAYLLRLGAQGIQLAQRHVEHSKKLNFWNNRSLVTMYFRSFLRFYVS